MLPIPEGQVSLFCAQICCWNLKSYYEVISQSFCHKYGEILNRYDLQ
jgi:hypothetical protein